MGERRANTRSTPDVSLLLGPKSFDNGTRPRLAPLASDRIFAIKDRKFRSLAKLFRIDIEIKPKHTPPASRSENTTRHFSSRRNPGAGDHGKSISVPWGEGGSGGGGGGGKGDLSTLRNGQALPKRPRIIVLPSGKYFRRTVKGAGTCQQFVKSFRCRESKVEEWPGDGGEGWGGSGLGRRCGGLERMDWGGGEEALFDKLLGIPNVKSGLG